MKRVFKKILTIILIVLLMNSFVINSFSNATVVPYLKLRNSGLSEEARLALVNAGNYLTTENFSNLLYCTHNTRDSASTDYPNLTKIQSSTTCSDHKSLPSGSITTSCADYCSYIYQKVLGIDQKYLSSSCYLWIQKITDYNNPSSSKYDEDCPFELVTGWDTNQLMPGDIIIYTEYKWSNGKLVKPRANMEASGHAMLYLGNNKYNDQDSGTLYRAHASGHASDVVVNKVDLSENNPDKLYYIIRIKSTYEVKQIVDYETAFSELFDIKNSNGKFTPLTELNYRETSTEIVNYGTYTTDNQGVLGRFDFSAVADRILGFLILLPKVIAIGFTAIMHKDLLTNIVNGITGIPLDGLITVEKIVFNQVPLLDINFFNFETARWYHAR